MQALATLEIRQCSGLKSINLDGLPDGLHLFKSFKMLTITDCPKLEAIFSSKRCEGTQRESEERLQMQALETLEIQVIQHLTSLRELSCYGKPKLKSLPEEIQHLPTLQYLSIFYFDGLVALPEWLGNLASLHTLMIVGCQNLMYLPTKEAVQRLTLLKDLVIIDCPLLRERCAKERGEEWFKIAHISRAIVRAKEVQQLVHNRACERILVDLPSLEITEATLLLLMRIFTPFFICPTYVAYIIVIDGDFMFLFDDLVFT
ncbi:hypothetical protein HHK36_020010 [Tetracentron sinense]|uniref:Uncharacterized protein n=1 Tax=Tetracentron sinense TaxID=13715 RepID=A0A835DAK2_TETSI|nr:hypothetical protein HHK36_020010 [Tetracentron sinense]